MNKLGLKRSPVQGSTSKERFSGKLRIVNDWVVTWWLSGLDLLASFSFIYSSMWYSIGKGPIWSFLEG